MSKIAACDRVERQEETNQVQKENCERRGYHDLHKSRSDSHGLDQIQHEAGEEYGERREESLGNNTIVITVVDAGNGAHP